MNTAREQRLRIFETDCGRTGGWFVEHKGRRIAELTDCRYDDMFWDSYAITALTDDPAEREQILASPDFWLACECVYRSKLFDCVVEHALPVGLPFPQPGRLKIRGLYLLISRPTGWERLLLWWRARKRAETHA